MNKELPYTDISLPTEPNCLQSQPTTVFMTGKQQQCRYVSELFQVSPVNSDATKYLTFQSQKHSRGKPSLHNLESDLVYTHTLDIRQEVMVENCMASGGRGVERGTHKYCGSVSERRNAPPWAERAKQKTTKQQKNKQKKQPALGRRDRSSRI